MKGLGSCPKMLDPQQLPLDAIANICHIQIGLQTSEFLKIELFVQDCC